MNQQRIPPGPRLYFDMDGVLTNYGAIQRTEGASPSGRERPQSEISFWINMPPMWRPDVHFGEVQPLGGSNTAQSLRHFEELFGRRLQILTSPSVKSPASYSGKAYWVEKHYGFNFAADRINMTVHKDLYFRPGEMDWLVDDNVSGNGQELWAEHGRLIHFGSDRFSNIWKVMGYFNKLKPVLEKFNPSHDSTLEPSYDPYDPEKHQEYLEELRQLEEEIR